jgi:hypothetical protein
LSWLASPDQWSLKWKFHPRNHQKPCLAEVSCMLCRILEDCHLSEVVFFNLLVSMDWSVLQKSAGNPMVLELSNVQGESLTMATLGCS